MLGETGSVLHQYWQILTDPAHILAELTIEAALAIPGLAYGRVWLRRHDKEKHSV